MLDYDYCCSPVNEMVKNINENLNIQWMKPYCRLVKDEY